MVLSIFLRIPFLIWQYVRTSLQYAVAPVSITIKTKAKDTRSVFYTDRTATQKLHNVKKYYIAKFLLFQVQSVNFTYIFEYSYSVVPYLFCSTIHNHNKIPLSLFFRLNQHKMGVLQNGLQHASKPMSSWATEENRRFSEGVEGSSHRFDCKCSVSA